MKSKQSEVGSAHIIIFIVVIVALLGALGFVVYKNYLAPKSTATASQITIAQPSTNNSGTSGTTKINGKTLSVPEWGVKGTYTGTTTYGYAQDDSTLAQSIHLTLPALSFCTSLGTIQRYTADQTYAGYANEGQLTAQQYFDGDHPAHSAHVGIYYYFFIHPQSICSDATTSLQQGLINASQEFTDSLTAI